MAPEALDVGYTSKTWHDLSFQGQSLESSLSSFVGPRTYGISSLKVVAHNLTCVPS